MKSISFLLKEGKENETFIRIRHKQNSNLKYEAHHKYIINTNQSYKSEIKEIKSKIWGIL